MISFLTLFLGLVVGTQSVQVQVAPDVAQVVIMLDGAVVSTLDAEPWSTEVDLGDELLPHRLEAVALDATGGEIDRAVQWLNITRSAAEASLSLVLDPEGQQTRARVGWETVVGASPRAVRVDLDGRALTVDDPREFSLPPYDPNRLHFLRVELDFADEVLAVAEATFGGFYTDEVNTELTSIVIDLGKDRDLELADLSGMFTVAGEPIEPVAVEKGSAEVIVVRDVTAHEGVRGIHLRTRSTNGRKAPPDFFVRHYWTTPRQSVVGEKRYLLHPHSGDHPLTTFNLAASFLVHGMQPTTQSPTQLIAGASAVAGMAAVSRNRRRAVLVILGEPGADQSFFTAGQVRSYLRAVDVPMVVWGTDAEQWEGRQHGWGRIHQIDASWQLLRAVDHLIDGLQRQRVVWFPGRHLPQQIEPVANAPFQRVGDVIETKRELRRGRRLRGAASSP